jgi:hypothetical protein
LATKHDKALAYDAGRHAFTTEPAERRNVDACPFALGTDERAEWLRGFGEAIDAAPHVPTLQQDVKDALKENEVKP